MTCASAVFHVLWEQSIKAVTLGQKKRSREVGVSDYKRTEGMGQILNTFIFLHTILHNSLTKWNQWPCASSIKFASGLLQLIDLMEVYKSKQAF